MTMSKYKTIKESDRMRITGLLILTIISTVASQSCDEANGWYELSGNCIRVSRSAPETQFTWQEAREACMGEGGDLAVINSQEEQDFIITLAANIGLTGNKLWVGMRQDGNSGAFGWVDGSAIVFDDWAASEPKTAGLTNCAFTLTQETPSGSFVRHDYVETTSGILDPDRGHIPSMADGVNTFYFGGGSQYDRTWCEYACTNNERCAAYTWYDYYHWNWQWQSQCVGRSDLYPILEYDSYGWSGVRSLGTPDGWWITGNCGLTHAFTCKKPVGSDTPVTVPPTPVVDSYCPEGYFSADGHTGNKCFRLYTAESEASGVRWEQAAVFCRNGPGVRPDIASIHSMEENAIITAHIQDYTVGYWIGLHYATSHTRWVWADNSEPQYANWGTGRPSGDQQCTELWSAAGPPGYWSNLDCSSGRGFICQTFKDAENIIPTPPPPAPTVCPEGWFSYWYACYRLDTTLRTWVGARDYCESLDTNSSLVSIHNEPENSAVFLGVEYNAQFPVWTGLHKASAEDTTYVWSDGWPTYYANFDGDSSAGGQGCVMMKDNAKWNDTSCENTYMSLCKKTDIDKPEQQPPGEGTCPNGNWVMWGNRCYYFSVATDTFLNSITSCQLLAGSSFTANLVSIENAAENNFVYTNLIASQYRYAAWVGLRFDASSSTFVWVDGTNADYRNWAPGEPNNPFNEPCVQMDLYYNYGAWNDDACDEYYYNYFVCEAELGPTVTYPPVPTSSPGECPSAEWVKSETGFCYLVRPTQDMHWFAASETCKTLTGTRGSLTSIADQVENQFVYYWVNFLTPDFEEPNIWIGMSKQGLGYPYLWEDGTDASYTNWAPGEPNDIDGSNNCVRMYASHGDPNYAGRWDDTHCSTFADHGYVCKTAQGSYAHLDQEQIAKDYQKILADVEVYKEEHKQKNMKKQDQPAMGNDAPPAVHDHANKGDKPRKNIPHVNRHHLETFHEGPAVHDHIKTALEMEKNQAEAEREFEQMIDYVDQNAEMEKRFEAQVDRVPPHDYIRDWRIGGAPFKHARKPESHAESGGSDSSSTGKVVGSVLGLFAGVMVITAVLVVVINKRRKRSTEPAEKAKEAVFSVSVETTPL